MAGATLSEEKFEREVNGSRNKTGHSSPTLATPTASMLSFFVPLVLVVCAAFVFASVLRPLEGTAPYQRQEKRKVPEGGQTAIKVGTLETVQETVGDATTIVEPGEIVTEATGLTREDESTSKIILTTRKKRKSNDRGARMTASASSTKRARLSSHHLQKKISNFAKHGEWTQNSSTSG